MAQQLESWGAAKESRHQDKRKFHRKPCYGRLEFSGGYLKHRGYIQNISSDGMYIEAREFIKKGKEIIIVLSLPFTSGPIKILGEVARTDEKGMGVEFKLSHISQKAAIKQFVNKASKIFGSDETFACPWAMVD